MSGLIMGIDGGGTKSHLLLFDTAGKLAVVSVCGALNHENMEGAFVQLEDTLNGFISGAVKKAGAETADIEYAVLGMAGVDTLEQHRIISEILKRIGLKNFHLCNDSFLGVAAGCPGGIGICAINGTGSVMAGVDRKGRELQICGIGTLSNDCGGGGWYAGKVYGAVYGELFKREKPTVLRKMLFEMLGISRRSDYTETLTAMLQNETLDKKLLSRLVFIAAGEGDEAAMDILNISAGHYSGGIIFLAEELDFPKDETLNVTFAGSVFTKEEIKILPRLIEKRVRAGLPGRDVEFLTLETVPAAGAVLWASQRAGVEMNIGDISRQIAL